MTARDLRAIALLCSCLALFYFAFAPRDPGFAAESNIYLAGAESIADSGQYRLITHVGSPWIGLYPPLQSIYLAAFWRMSPDFPNNLWLLNLAMILLVLAASTSFFLIMRRRELSPFAAASCSLVFGVSPTLYFLAFSFFSDLLFAVLAFLLLLIWVKPQQSRYPWFQSGLILAGMYLTRTAAVGMIVPFATLSAWASLKWKSPKPIVQVTAPLIAAFGLWNVLMPHQTPTYMNLLASAYRDHTGWFEQGWPGYRNYLLGQFVEFTTGNTLLHSLVPQFETILSATFPNSFVHLTFLGVGGLCVAFALVGFFQDTWQWKFPAFLILAVYSTQLILWPWRLEGRTVLPILPLVVVWSLKGCETLTRIKTRAPALLFALFCPGALLLNIVGSFQQSEWLSVFAAGPELREVAEYVRDQIPNTATIGGGNDLPIFQFYHYSGMHRFQSVKFGPVRAGEMEDFNYVLLWQGPEKCSGALQTTFRSSSCSYQFARVDGSNAATSDSGLGR